jgi:hypothetical protein
VLAATIIKQKTWKGKCRLKKRKKGDEKKGKTKEQDLDGSSKTAGLTPGHNDKERERERETTGKRRTQWNFEGLNEK